MYQAIAFVLSVMVFGWLAVLTKMVLDLKSTGGIPLDEEKLQMIYEKTRANRAALETALADHPLPTKEKTSWPTKH